MTSKTPYEDNNVPNRLERQSDLEENKMQDANKVARQITGSCEEHIPFGMNPENSQLENGGQQKEDVAQHIPVFEQRLRLDSKTAVDLADSSNSDLDRIEQRSNVCRTNSEQQIQQPIDTVDEKLIKLLGLADGQKFLTEGQLKKLNEELESDALNQQKTIDFLIRREINITDQDSKTQLSAIDTAWEYEYYYCMMMLLEADTEFPHDFNLDSFYQDNEIPNKLKVLVSTRQKLHESIKQNELEQVQKLSNGKLSKFLNSENKSALETAAAYANVEILACLTNIQLPLGEITLTVAQLKLLKRVNEEGNTLLSIAAESGRKDNVNFFITCGIDINHQNKIKQSAIDLAWGNEHYDIVLALLKADSNFPCDFNLGRLNEHNAQKELKEFVEIRDNLHKLIEEDRLGDIQDLIATSGSKFYLNRQSQSAVFTAIEKKRFAIYAFLKSNGIMFKSDGEKVCISNLLEGEKHMLKTELDRRFPRIIQDQGHIYYLMSKSRSQKPVKNTNNLIEKLYKDLDSIPEVSIILKVVQYTDYLDIIFDFDNENIEDIDPTTSKAIKGTTYCRDGRIYIGAKKEENVLLGTLAHELTHLAMYVLYKNDCNPFDNLRNDKRQSFEEIAATIKEYTKNKVKTINSNTEDSPLVTLARVFTYPEYDQQSELIARIPHILAQYGDEGRRWLNKIEAVKSLFDYYTNQRKEWDEFINNSYLIKPRNNIQVINEYFGEINDINNIIKDGIHFENPIDIDHFLTSSEQVFLLKTENTMLLSILSIYESLIITNKNYFIQDSFFLKLNSYIEKRDEINNLLYSAAGKMLCIRYSYDSVKEKLSDVLEILNTLLEQKSDKKVIFVISRNKTEEFNEIKRVFNNKCSEEETDCKFTLNDLTEESQQKILKREVIFQGERMSLKNLIDKSDKNSKQIIDGETLEGLITNKVIRIGSRPLGTTDLEGAYSELVEEINIKTFIDKLLSEESSDIYIISGISGPGKVDRLIEYLRNADIDYSKKSEDLKLGSRVAVLNRDTNGAINNRILVTDDHFRRGNFMKICKSNRGRQIYWINRKDEDNVSKFMLEQIYNPDYYLKDDRFHSEVVIEKNVKEQLTCCTLTETFFIYGTSKEQVAEWLRFSNNEERIRFEENYKDHRIKFLNSLTFQELVEQNHDQTFHLLVFEQDQLVWCETHSSLMNLKKYKDYRNTERSIGEDTLITKIKNDKVVIIAGDPGMGKTTTLVKLYESQYASESGTEESMIKSHWLITVNLKDHLDAIRDIDFNKPTETIRIITDFLSQVDKSISDDFTKSLLGIALVKQDFGKPLLIAFDGFDEVLDKENRDKIVSLLKYLKAKTEAKFWITTRFHYQQTLESTLSTFAVKLEPIGDAATRKFIKKYLQNHVRLILSHEEYQSIFGDNDEIIENTRMQVYTAAFLRKMHGVFKDDVSKIIGTPLQLYLMLEGSIRYFKDWARDVNGQIPDFSYLGSDIWEVYENFVDRKYSIYFKKAKVKEQLKRDQDKVIFDEYHKALAKSIILKTAPKQSLEKFRDIVLTAGIVRSDGSNIEFLHPTFGDYFAAKVFLNWIVKLKVEYQHKLTNPRKQGYLLTEILVKSDYQVIRIFLNSKLLIEKMTFIHLHKKYCEEKILFVAARENNVGIAGILFDNTANSSSILNARDHVYGKTALGIAVIFSNPEMVKYLIGKGANVNTKDRVGESDLYAAARSGHLETFKTLIDMGINCDVKNVLDETVLHTAVMCGHLEMVKILISQGDNIDAKDNFDLSALHIAAQKGNLEMFKILIDEGADIDAKNKKGESVLYMAARSDQMKMVKILIDKGADLDAKDLCGQSVLHMAAQSGHLEMVKSLIDKGADIHAKSKNGASVLHMAAQFGHLEVVKILMDEGADIHAKNNNGMSVLHVAALSGQLEIVKILLNQGANFDTKDNPFIGIFLRNIKRSASISKLVQFYSHFH
nr:uncharacterized protein LOC117225642 isoform X2 [Megalopta genalis]